MPIFLAILIWDDLRSDEAGVALVCDHTGHWDVESIDKSKIPPDYFIEILQILMVVHCYFGESSVADIVIILHVFQLNQT